MTPTARSMELLRELGYTVDVVERWIPRTRTRRDLFGFADLLAIHPTGGILLIQTTTGSNGADRLKKMLAEPQLQSWLLAGGRAELWTWRLGGKAGKRKTWTCRRTRVERTGDGLTSTVLADVAGFVEGRDKAVGVTEEEINATTLEG